MPGNIVLDEREAVNSGQRSAISNVSSYQSPQAAFLAVAACRLINGFQTLEIGQRVQLGQQQTRLHFFRAI